MRLPSLEVRPLMNRFGSVGAKLGCELDPAFDGHGGVDCLSNLFDFAVNVNHICRRSVTLVTNVTISAC
jgi:hypothetical protein